MPLHMPETWRAIGSWLTNRQISSTRCVCAAAALGCRPVSLDKWSWSKQLLQDITGRGLISTDVSAAVETARIDLLGDACSRDDRPELAAVWGSLHWIIAGVRIDWVEEIASYAIRDDYMMAVYGHEACSIEPDLHEILKAQDSEFRSWTPAPSQIERGIGALLSLYMELANHGLDDALDRGIIKGAPCGATYPLWDSNPQPPD